MLFRTALLSLTVALCAMMHVEFVSAACRTTNTGNTLRDQITTPSGYRRGGSLQSPYSSGTSSTSRAVVSGGRNPCRRTPDCVSPNWATQTRDMGRFRMTGYPAMLQLAYEAFQEVRSSNPTLYNNLGRTVYHLCCRCIRSRSGQCRGSASSFSNHAYGLAFDIFIDDDLDVYGDGCTQKGLIELFPYLHRKGFYWGAGFSTEDSMHFEISEQLLQQWRSGSNVPSVPNTNGGSSSGTPCTYGGSSGKCFDSSRCRSSGGSAYSSSTGARGCQRFPSNVRCCILQEEDSALPCTYQGRRGQCEATWSCSGSSFSSSAGASGCEKEPNHVRCCVAAARTPAPATTPAPTRRPTPPPVTTPTHRPYSPPAPVPPYRWVDGDDSSDSSGNTNLGGGPCTANGVTGKCSDVYSCDGSAILRGVGDVTGCDGLPTNYVCCVNTEAYEAATADPTPCRYRGVEGVCASAGNCDGTPFVESDGATGCSRPAVCCISGALDGSQDSCQAYGDAGSCVPVSSCRGTTFPTIAGLVSGCERFRRTVQCCIRDKGVAQEVDDSVPADDREAEVPPSALTDPLQNDGSYYRVTEEQFRCAFPRSASGRPSDGEIEQWMQFLNRAILRYGIARSHARLVAFLAETGFETGGYNTFTEYGNECEGYSGGCAYKGRGALQLTHKENYEMATDALSFNFVENPEAVATPAWAFETAGLFWQSRGLNAMADQGLYTRILQTINGCSSCPQSRITQTKNDRARIAQCIPSLADEAGPPAVTRCLVASSSLSSVSGSKGACRKTSECDARGGSNYRGFCPLEQADVTCCVDPNVSPLLSLGDLDETGGAGARVPYEGADASTSDSLSAGAIAGIVIGVLFVVGIIVVVACWSSIIAVNRSRANKQDASLISESSRDSSLGTTSNGVSANNGGSVSEKRYPNEHMGAPSGKDSSVVEGGTVKARVATTKGSYGDSVKY